MSFNTFFQKLVPKDKKFFPMFESQADLIVQAAGKLNEIFLTEDHEKHAVLFKIIKDLENQGDELAHQIFDELDKTFITPFDREDIHQLTSKLDDVLDFINGTSQRIRLYKLRDFPAEFVKFSEVLQQGGMEIRNAVGELYNLKRPEMIRQACIRINEVENQADDLYHHVISDLFENEKDAIELIKKKEVLQTMERASDRMEDVADVLKTIIIKVA
jgi:predicted phosphate transport protein (TIGR00153 family)